MLNRTKEFETESRRYRQPPVRVRSAKPRRPRKVPVGQYYLRGLRDVRLRKWVTQEDLAKAAGVSRVTISRLEWGDHRAKPETIKKLAKALGVDFVELVRPPRKRKDPEDEAAN